MSKGKSRGTKGTGASMRTNIVIDDKLMKATGLKTKREAVGLALRTLLRERRDQRNGLTHKPDVYEADAEAATPDDARSAILACSTLVTSMMTPPFSISARPVFTRNSSLRNIVLS